MKKMILFRFFRLSALFLYLFVLLTNFHSQNAPYAFTGFFAYDFNAYSVILIVFNIFLGFLTGIDHMFKEEDYNTAWAVKVRRPAIIVIPLLYLSLGIYVYTTFYNIEAIRILYMYAGILHMTVTDSIGAYNATALLLLSAYALQIIIGFILGKSVIKREKSML